MRLPCFQLGATTGPRTPAIHWKLLEASGQSEDFNQLFEMLRYSADHDATTMLARLRLGDPMEDFFEAVRTATSPTENIQTRYCLWERYVL